MWVDAPTSAWSSRCVHEISRARAISVSRCSRIGSARMRAMRATLSGQGGSEFTGRSLSAQWIGGVVMSRSARIRRAIAATPITGPSARASRAADQDRCSTRTGTSHRVRVVVR